MISAGRSTTLTKKTAQISRIDVDSVSSLADQLGELSEIPSYNDFERGMAKAYELSARWLQDILNQEA